jgi:seryl-tRNA synthetase
MLDLKAIRKQPELYKQGIERKGMPGNVINDLLSADEVKRDLQSQTESLKAEQNEASKRIPQLTGDEKASALSDMKLIADKRKALEADLERASTIVDDLLMSLPNIPKDEVPDGKGEEGNTVVRFEGEKQAFDFEPKEHWELAEALDLLDMEQAAKVSGSRFYYLRNELAMLQQALMMWAFREVSDKGYSPTIPPFMTRKEAIVGTGFFDRDENYCVNPGEDDLYLIGTSEVPMVSIHADQVIDLSKGPIRYAAYSPCFRREAGSYGKDTKGILRVHQFEKIEMVVFCKPEDTVAVHESLRETEEEILKALGIHYQVVNIGCGDLGLSASKKYDLEAWLPGQKQYREMTSTSICDDFQTRRLNIRYKDEDGKLQFAQALNGTAVSSRPLIAILENGQNADGSIDIPEVLWPFTGFKKIEVKG